MPRTPEAVYRSCYSRRYIETGPKLVSVRDKSYLSFDRLFELAAPYLGPVSVGNLPALIEVPTPWHAVAIATRIQHALVEEGHHAIFRGQSNSSYSLLPSIFRPGTDRAAHDRAKRLTAWFLAATAYQYYGTLEPVLFYGAAQHYQIRTNLLDFTPDPAVAVWFAGLPRNPTDEHPCHTASVYVLPLDAAYQRGLHLILPPPFVERLHRQRGIFIAFDAEEPIPLSQVTELRFPANLPSAPYHFVVVRHGHRVDLLRDHDWIRKVVTWAQTLAADPDVYIPREITQVGTEKIRAMLANGTFTGLDDPVVSTTFRDTGVYLRGLQASGITGSFYNKPVIQHELGRWLDAFNDYLYWLCFRLTPDREYLAAAAIRPMLRQNLDLARMYVTVGIQSKRKGFAGHARMVAAVLEQLERENTSR
jgi:hypothetical protein